MSGNLAIAIIEIEKPRIIILCKVLRIYMISKDHSVEDIEVAIAFELDSPVFEGSSFTLDQRLISSFVVNQVRQSNGAISETVQLLLKKIPYESWSIERLSSLCCMSSRTFSRRLRQEGVSFREISTLVRNQSARELLKNTKIPISEISRKLGYSDQSNFTKAFKRMNQVSPRQFRVGS